ncbi:MAG: KTSC domain-containing protein [Dehalococcoidia bacterium]
MRTSIVSMNPVVSSNIAAVGYDGEVQTLYVQFHPSMKTYKYFNVPVDVYDSFLGADSKGKFFASNIRGKYEYSQI